MKDILLAYEDSYIECEVNGLELTYTFSDDPKYHYNVRLHDSHSYLRLKAEVNKIYDDYTDHAFGYEAVEDFLQSPERYEFIVKGSLYVCRDLRDEDEILDYCKEACDKVWLMRTRPCDEFPDIEADRQAAVRRILRTYKDIPRDGYSDWECGYWNGIMGALRWVMGDEKDFLDT